jgi:hypothetical protein
MRVVRIVGEVGVDTLITRYRIQYASTPFSDVLRQFCVSVCGRVKAILPLAVKLSTSSFAMLKAFH